MAITNKLTYELISPTFGSRVVSPLGESSFKIKWDLNDAPDDPLLDYLVSFDGSLTFAGGDYEWIKAIEESEYRCENIQLVIKNPDCGDAELVANTIIKLSDGEYNVSRCQVKISVSTVDKYEEYNLKKDDELNIFDADTERILTLPLSADSHIQCAFFERGPTTISMDEDGLYNYWPNHNAEYPGYGIDTEEGTYGVLTNVPLFNFFLYAVNAPTGNARLYDGCTMPYNGDYGSAALAAADGWRLYWSYYRIDVTPTGGASEYGQWGWCREVREVPTGTVLTGWIFVSTDGTNDTYARPPRMVRRVRDWKCEAVGGETVISAVDGGDKCIVLSQYSNYIVGLLDFDCGGMFGGSSFRNGVKLSKIIEYTAAYLFPSLTVKSDFFQINPWVTSSLNPVTGDETTTDNIIVYQKTDILRPYVTEEATKGLYKPSELFEWLLQQFKVKFRIDENYIYIEYETSDKFVHAPVYDITTEPINFSKNVYRYDKINLPSKETFDFMEKKYIDMGVIYPVLSDFNGANILYDGVCVDRSRDSSTNNIKVSRITNDVEFLLSESEIEGSSTRKTSANVSDDGFVFIATKISGGYNYAISASPILAGIDQINNVMGWAWLHQMFFRNKANSNTGTLNNASVTFDTTRYIKTATGLQAKECCIAGFDPFATVTSALGEGRIKTADYSVKNNLITLELGYTV